MTCHHSSGDPSCSSHPDNIRRSREEYERKQKAKREAELRARTPDPDDYEVVDAKTVDGHLVMKVRYASCSKCSFDAQKVMVFANVDIVDALKWKRIDPHFDDKDRPRTEAPPPVARFPANDRGWADALLYARQYNKPPVYRGE